MTSVRVSRLVYTLLSLAIGRNSEVKKMILNDDSDSEWNSFANLSTSSDEYIMVEDEEDVEESLTHRN